MSSASLQFGYAGKWFPIFPDVQRAAFLVKSDPTPVGVEALPGNNTFRVVTQNEFQQAALSGRLVWVA